MSRQVEIPGGLATFRDPTELRGRDRLLVQAAYMAAEPALTKMPKEVMGGKTEDETDEEFAARIEPLVKDVHFTWQESMLLFELRQAAVVSTLASWTLSEPLPDMETIGDLPDELYTALDKAIGGVPMESLVAPVDFTTPGDDGTPTGGSSSSEESLNDDLESGLILLSPSDSALTSGESSSPEL